MKKLWVVLLSLLLAVVLVVSFFLITAGRVYEADGKVQNTRIYIKDIQYADGVLTCTVVNKTWSHASGRGRIEKKIDGEWQPFSLRLGFLQPATARIYQPFRASPVRMIVTLDKSELVGEYRVVGCGVQSHRLSDVLTEAVGYFTITEDMLQ